MTKEEYQQYCKRFAHFMKFNDLRNLSIIDSEIDPHFSWSPCDCCNRPLGGNRYDCNGYSPSNGIMEFTCCGDCIYFAEYGKLDDLTMLELE